MKTRRGNPNSSYKIHFNHLGYDKPEPLCRNGSYHVWLTDKADGVTCDACKESPLWDIYRRLKR